MYTSHAISNSRPNIRSSVFPPSPQQVSMVPSVSGTNSWRRPVFDAQGVNTTSRPRQIHLTRQKRSRYLLFADFCHAAMTICPVLSANCHVHEANSPTQTDPAFGPPFYHGILNQVISNTWQLPLNHLSSWSPSQRSCTSRPLRLTSRIPRD